MRVAPLLLLLLLATAHCVRQAEVATDAASTSTQSAGSSDSVPAAEVAPTPGLSSEELVPFGDAGPGPAGELAPPIEELPGVSELSAAAPDQAAAVSEAPEATPATAAEPTPAAPRANLSSVVLTWKVGTDPVDGYIIYYGRSAAQLDQEVRVPVDSLRRVIDDRHGEVFEYTIQSVPADEELTVSIAAYVADEISERSAPFVIAPAEMAGN